MKSLILLIFVTTVAAVSGCATAPQTASDAVTNKVEKAAVNQSAAVTTDIGLKPFTIDSLYELLVAEVAVTRYQFDIALPKYLQQARLTRDRNIIKMALDIAMHKRNDQAALEMALLWIEVEPERAAAQSAAMQTYALLGDGPSALIYASQLYQQHNNLEAFLAVTSIHSNSAQINALINAYQQLPLSEEKQPAVILATGMLYLDDGQLMAAQEAASRFLLSAPGDRRGLILLAQILQQREHFDQAVKLLTTALKKTPDDHLLRLQYARLLTLTDRNKAIAQFEILHAKNPDDHDINYLLALLLHHRGQTTRASALLTQALDNPDLRANAHFHLGSIAEDQGNLDKAARHYSRVLSGRNYLAATSKLVALLARHNDVATARKYLQQLRKKRPAQSAPLLQIESRLLISVGRADQALRILSDGLNEFPDNRQLLHARSMVAEQQNNFDLAEQDLSRLIALDENDATALNALGYGLILHTDRYEEAHTLIKRAYLLRPDNPAIIDSMGWVLFQLGQSQQALEHLQKAMDIMPDPEIAAHLGEVTWSLGHHQEALQVWQSSLQQFPEDQKIIETMQRLGATPNSSHKDAQP